MNNLQTPPNQSPIGYGLIGLGLLFLSTVIFGYSIFDLWPFFIIVPGVVMFLLAQRGNGPSGLAVPGAITAGTGFILLYQYMTGHWESWAYAWALYPVFTGIGLSVVAERSQNETMMNSVKASMRWGMIAFALGWAFFEGIIFNSGGFNSLIVPLILILSGVGMLYWRPQQKQKFSENGKAKYADVYPRPEQTLQARIDAALAEDDEEIMR